MQKNSAVAVTAHYIVKNITIFTKIEAVNIVFDVFSNFLEFATTNITQTVAHRVCPAYYMNRTKINLHFT